MFFVFVLFSWGGCCQKFSILFFSTSSRHVTDYPYLKFWALLSVLFSILHVSLFTISLWLIIFLFSACECLCVCVCERWMKSQRAGLPLCMPQAKPFLGGLLWDLHPGWIRALDLISISLFTSAHKRKRSAAQKHANWCWERHGEVQRYLSKLVFFGGRVKGLKMSCWKILFQLLATCRQAIMCMCAL